MTELDHYLRIINLRVHLALELLRKSGSEDQIARYARGAMPVDELLTMARAELFEPFAGIDLKRFAKNRDLGALYYKVEHSPFCPEQKRDDSELHENSIAGAPLLSAGQQKHLLLLRERVAKATEHEWLHPRYWLDKAEPITLDTVTHIVSCAACTRSVMCVSAKVSIRWAEHTLVREWVL